MSYIGIDYGLGQANIDPETGIHFGVISMHDVDFWSDGSEPVYGSHCPHCGNEIDQEIKDKALDHSSKSEEEKEARTCPHCNKILNESDFFEDEPVGYVIKDDKYFATQSHDDTDIFVEKSIYYTICGFCSPCAPGAGDILNQVEEGIKTYCFGHDMFENEAPYAVYEVATGKKVEKQ
jgi:hypothetical protein